jgi:hypothetical protein
MAMPFPYAVNCTPYAQFLAAQLPCAVCHLPYAELVFNH